MKSTVIYMTSYSNSPHHSLLYGESVETMLGTL